MARGVPQYHALYRDQCLPGAVGGLISVPASPALRSRPYSMYEPAVSRPVPTYLTPGAYPERRSPARPVSYHPAAAAGAFPHRAAARSLSYEPSGPPHASGPPRQPAYVIVRTVYPEYGDSGRLETCTVIPCRRPAPSGAEGSPFSGVPARRSLSGLPERRSFAGAERRSLVTAADRRSFSGGGADQRLAVPGAEQRPFSAAQRRSFAGAEVRWSPVWAESASLGNRAR